MRREPGGDNGFADDGSEPTEPTYPSGPTGLVPPVDPYFDPADPFEVDYPTAEPTPSAPAWYASPAILFGIVGTLLGLIALAVVTTTNCGRLGLCAEDLGAVNLLPPPDAARYLVSTNPRLPGGLAADVNQLLDQIPATDQPRARSFIAGTRFFAGRLPTAQTNPACGYQPGELAVRLYQDRGSAWSVGLAVVAAGTLANVFDEASPCFLGHRIDAMIPVSADDSPAPAFCDAQPRDGFTVLTLGSTVGACADLTGSTTLPVRTVGDPDTALRAEPGTAGPPTLRVRPGTVATVLCHRNGWARLTFPVGTPDILTGKSTEDEHTGYVAAADLDAGPDLPQRIRACASATPTATATATATANPNATTPTPAAPPSTPPAFSPAAVNVGDCVANRGTPERPELRIVACADPASYRVLLKATGVSIPEGPDGEFDATTANTVCAGTQYDSWYGNNAIDDTGDVFLCLMFTAKSH
jgi:hypothetical protein